MTPQLSALTSRSANTVAVTLLMLGAISCGGTAAPSDQVPATGSLRITWPPNGAALCTDVAKAVTAKGTAPALSRVVLDISFGPDEEDIADAGGSWSIVTAVREGSNELTFRIGDDRDTEETVRFSFRLALSMPQDDCVDAVGPIGGVRTPAVVVSETCGAAFEVVSPTDFNGTFAQLEPTVEACTMAEWIAEFESRNEFGLGIDADSALGLLCGSMPETPLCLEWIES